MKNPIAFFLPSVAAILSAVLLILSFHPYQVGGLAWFALVPLLVAMSGKSAKAGFFLSGLSMMIFFAVVFAFTFQIPRYGILHHVLLDIYLGAVYGCFGLGYSYLHKKWGGGIALLGSPFLWICLEYVRFNFGMLSFPWVLLAYSQYTNLPIIQVAAVAGPYGVSFLIVMVNAGIAAVVLAWADKMRRGRAPLEKRAHAKSMVAIALAAAALLAFSWAYGKRVIDGGLSGRRVKISVIQANIAQNKKWDRRYAAQIMETYAELTAKAAKEKPELIIWPETATPRSITMDLSLRKQVVAMANRSGACILLGSAERQKFEKKPTQDVKFFNSAFLFNPFDPAKNQKYEKIHLFPFGEYLPLKGIIPWSVLNIPEMGGYLPGKEYTVFECGGFRFGVTICWELLFPELARIAIRDGAQVMVNITNEAWFGKTVGPYLVLTAAVFRAVENRVYLARSANTSLSCFIDPHGRIVDRVTDENGEDLFVGGVLTNTVVPMDAKTPYTRYGNWFVWLSMVGVGGLLLTGFWRKTLA